MDRMTTRLSSKGQVVIPARARRALGWRPGQELRVDLTPSPAPRTLVLRPRTAPEVQALLDRGYAWLEQGRVDLVEALHVARRRARARERRPRRR